MKIYIAAPLFNDSERKQNLDIRDFLKGLGFETYLPQEDGGISFERIASGADITSTRRDIFKGDIEAIRKSDVFLFILDGRVPDEGACVELGVAFAFDKVCIGYQTDQRSLDRYGNNLMIEGTLSDTGHSFEELKNILKKTLPKTRNPSVRKG